MKTKKKQGWYEPGISLSIGGVIEIRYYKYQDTLKTAVPRSEVVAWAVPGDMAKKICQALNSQNEQETT